MPDLTLLRSLLVQAVSDNIVLKDNGAFHHGATGVVVSGGVDSSTVCAIARDLVGDLPTFTGYYDTEGFDERPYARLVAGANHHEIPITPQDFIEDLARTMTDRRIRHVPVVVDGHLVAIVSIGDIVKWRIDELQTERDQLVGYIQQ